MTARVGGEVGAISIARTVEHFGRDTSTMARTVAGFETKMRGAKLLRRITASLVKELRIVY
jgi:hypothetical protein